MISLHNADCFDVFPRLSSGTVDLVCADMQFLLWDAQRRAGISDEQINQAMVEKLAVNKQRQWPEPLDGEPRLHIKADQHQGDK